VGKYKLNQTVTIFEMCFLIFYVYAKLCRPIVFHIFMNSKLQNYTLRYLLLSSFLCKYLSKIVVLQVRLDLLDPKVYRAILVVQDYRVSLDLPDQAEPLEPPALQELRDSECQEQQVPPVEVDFPALLAEQVHKGLQEQLAGLELRAIQVGAYEILTQH